MIDPIHSLAFSIHSNRGVYAILLGSGISRAAKIPTGWEITLDLIRQLAAIQDDTAEPDPSAWYKKEFGEDPDYSQLLENLAKTQAERQQLLRIYWEPNEQERDAGEKQPTAAHHAIAELVAQNFIKVIITTNFDRLMEKALRDVGIEPTVLSTPDHVQGALPLTHTKCCVIKLHGDYLDTRIRNTATELEAYSIEFDQLLDRIFDEFGIIVCGWSAMWDEALRKAIYRCKSRRFTTYWAVRSDPGDEALRLISHRKAEVLKIEDADTFFETVRQHVESIEEFSKPHPLSTEAAVMSLKRYLSESKYRIQHSDLVSETINRVIEIVSGEDFALQGGPPPSSESITARVRGYDAACSTLLAMATVGSYWAEKDHFSVWRMALERLTEVNERSGYRIWIDLQRYPATLLLYALGLGALNNNKRIDFLGYLLATKVVREGTEKKVPVIEILHPTLLDKQSMQCLEGMERHHMPLNDWLHDELRKYMKYLTVSDNRYTLMFDKLEVLISLSCIFQKNQSRENMWGRWVPVGSFLYRRENRDRVIQDIQNSIRDFGEDSVFVKCGIFGDTVDECLQSISFLMQFIDSNAIR